MNIRLLMFVAMLGSGGLFAAGLAEGEFWNMDEYVEPAPVTAHAAFSFPFDATEATSRESASNLRTFSTYSSGMFIIVR